MLTENKNESQAAKSGSILCLCLAMAFLLATSTRCLAAAPATLDDLKKLEIICFVPSYLPEGFHLKSVEITYEELHEEFDDMKHPLPLYALEYGDEREGTFSIETAREGIGDRNIMEEEEDSEESEMQTPIGVMYLIFRPKGKDGRKVEILTNWVQDANMNAEDAKRGGGHPVLGRFHGFTATGITLAEFEKIVQSLRPLRSDASPTPTPAATATPTAAPASALKIHPKVFNMIECWISDSTSPVVTEINLDAVEKNGNQFDDGEVKPDGEWTRCPVPESNGGFMRYRVLESKGNHCKIEYQENGGGTLTTAAIIEFSIDEREIQRDGMAAKIRVLRVLSYQQK
jgi:hypothetical protein